MVRGQVSIMEYVLMTFFIIVIILGLLFFLSWWQFTQIGMQEHKTRMERVFMTARYMSNSPYFVKENSFFDDAKLTAAKSLGSSVCKDFESLFGYDCFIKVRVFDGDLEIPCTWGNYPDCNSWEFCTKNQRNISRILPVNIYRKISESNGVGTMEVGVYI
jgi:hypothetical protein